MAKKSLFFPLFGKKTFLNRTLGLSKSFLNQTTYVLKNRLLHQSFLNQDSFLNQAFLNRECTVLTFFSLKSLFLFFSFDFFCFFSICFFRFFHLFIFKAWKCTYEVPLILKYIYLFHTMVKCLKAVLKQPKLVLEYPVNLCHTKVNKSKLVLKSNKFHMMVKFIKQIVDMSILA